MAIKTLLIRYFRLGVGIASTDVEYACSSSSKSAPVTGWQTDAPQWVNGHYIWSRTHIIYTNGLDKYSEPVCLPSGKGIASIVEQYYKSTSSAACTGGSWDNIAPTWESGYYIWTRSVIKYTDGTTYTTQAICTTGADGESGLDGKDAITINLSLTAINHKQSTAFGSYVIYAHMFKGNAEVSFSYKASCQDTNVQCTPIKIGDLVSFLVGIKAGAVVNSQVTLSFIYDGVTYTREIPITTVSDGDKGDPGERGAVLRGPQLWQDCGIGYNFEDGGAGMEWKDTVVYNNNTYSCIKSHVKTADNYPGSDEDVNNGYWRVGSPIELIVANIIMSRYQLVKNLGVETIEMRDSAGNVIFQAKDGEVLANKGTFNNVNVSGRFFSRDPRTWNEVEIDANNGGLTMRGPSSVLDDNFDLPSTNATLKDLFKIFYDFDADSLRRLAVLKIFGKDDNDYVKISGNGDLCLSYYSDSVLLTPTGISYTDERTGKNYNKDWSDLLK